MILSGVEIRKAIDSRTWRAWRDNESVESGDLKVNPHSIDLGLCDTFVRIHALPLRRVIDPRSKETMETTTIKTSGFFDLEPHQFVLGAVRERFDCTAPLWISTEGFTGTMRFTQKYDGRSSMARLGIFSHVSSGYGDYGFSGAFTVELFNCSQNTVRLYPGMRIGQVSFEAILGEVELYEGAYNEQFSGPRAASLGKDRF